MSKARKASLQLQEILFSQGFGTRRVCAGLIQQGLVQVCAAGESEPVTVEDATQEYEPEGLCFWVQGVRWEYHALAYVVMNKPAGVECSQKPSAWPSVYTLLPSPLRCRPQKGATQGVQGVGRLDQDTTGMLLLTDDGTFIHRMNSPKRHVPKVYDITLKHAVRPEMVERLLAGVVLDDDPAPVRAAACEIQDELHLRMTLTQGKYHQVKRMVAAVGNRVEGLHRSQIGSLALPADLAPGHWRWLRADELVAVQTAVQPD